MATLSYLASTDVMDKRLSKAAAAAHPLASGLETGLPPNDEGEDDEGEDDEGEDDEGEDEEDYERPVSLYGWLFSIDN